MTERPAVVKGPIALYGADHQVRKVLGKNVWLDLVTIQRCLPLTGWGERQAMTVIEESLDRLVAAGIAERRDVRQGEQWRLARPIAESHRGKR